MTAEENKNDQWELWEVFLQGKTGEAHIHAGSLRAADKEMALQNARDVYSRREKFENIWVVKSKDIIASTQKDNDSFFGTVEDKIYRHPQFYKLPDGMKNEFKK
ncbi:MAG: 1,2-phenylacetyl-CoA epoxidase subunit B [Bacteroidetes bacterium]|nr:1,2-phenylacetyl-CoA epoxidase subunit B [Bacteroidota bacterium]